MVSKYLSDSSDQHACNVINGALKLVLADIKDTGEIKGYDLEKYIESYDEDALGNIELAYLEKGDNNKVAAIIIATLSVGYSARKIYEVASEKEGSSLIMSAPLWEMDDDIIDYVLTTAAEVGVEGIETKLDYWAKNQNIINVDSCMY